jgi:UDP-glucose 4-epimerase
MRVMVTGGAGFIGSHLVDRLVEHGHEVLVVDDLSQGIRENVHPKARLIVQDITDPTIRKVLLDFKPQVVYHWAAHIDVRKSVSEPYIDARTNVIGMLNLLEASREARVRRVVFASTGGAIYGETPEPASEMMLPNPISPYAVSKLACEGYLYCYNLWHDLPCVALRYANVYGPRQDPLGEAGVVAIFSQKLLNGEAPTLYGHGHLERDYVFVTDAVEAAIRALDRGDGEVINIGTGVATSVSDLYRMMGKICGYAPEPRLTDARPGELRKSILDWSKAERVLQWRPGISLNEGLKRTIDWFRDREN